MTPSSTTTRDATRAYRSGTHAGQAAYGPAGDSAGSDRRITAWLAGVVLVAAAVRLVGLNGGLWLDEVYAVVDYFRSPLREILTVFGSDTQHPLYTVLAHAAIVAFGEHAWSARLPALVFGVATVPALYMLGALVASRREGLLAAALLAVSYHHVWFSQNARGYTALAFFAVLCTYLLIRGLREERWPLWLAYATGAALGVYTHLTMVFLVASHVIIAGWYLAAPAVADPALARSAPERRPDWRLPVAGFVASASFGALLYAPTFGQVLDFFLHRPSPLRGVSTPRWAFLEALRILQIGVGAAGLLVAGIVVACGAWSYLRRDRLALACFTLPGVVTLGGALLARGTMYPRFFFFLVGFALLTVVRGTLVVGGWLAVRLGTPEARRSMERPATFGTALAGLLIVTSAATLPLSYRHPKQDFDGALRFVNERRAPGDRVAAIGPAAFVYRRYLRQPWDSIRTAADFARVRSHGEPVWLLYVFPRYLDASLAAVIRRECPHVRGFPGTVGGGDVFVCRAEPLAPRSAAPLPQFEPMLPSTRQRP